MKKSVKVVALVAILSASLFMLTGCGEEKKNQTSAQPQTTSAGNNSSSSSNANSNSNSDSNSSTILQVPMQVRNLVPNTEITELYLSGAGLDNWGDELLGNQTMPTGTQLSVVFNIDKKNVKWDIKAVDEEGTAVEFRNLDLSNVSTNGGVITLTIEDGTPVATAQ